MNPNKLLMIGICWASDPSPDDDDDDATLEAFKRIYGKVTTKWPEMLKGSISSVGEKITEAPKELAGFLQKALDKSEEAREKLAAQLDLARDQMSPEQLTQFRLALKSADPTKSEPTPSDKKPVPPADPIIPPKPKRKWL